MCLCFLRTLKSFVAFSVSPDNNDSKKLQAKFCSREICRVREFCWWHFIVSSASSLCKGCLPSYRFCLSDFLSAPSSCLPSTPLTRFLSQPSKFASPGLDVLSPSLQRMEKRMSQLSSQLTSLQDMVKESNDQQRLLVSLADVFCSTIWCLVFVENEISHCHLGPLMWLVH